MLTYILRRLLYMIPVMFIISILVFLTIQLPPGDPITKMIENQRLQQGRVFSEKDIEMMQARFGYGDPLPVQYTKWIGNIVLRGDFGYSFYKREEAGKVIADLMPLTIAISLGSFIFTWIVALPIGVLSAVRQYSIADYVFTFIGFIGLAIPNFLLALILLVLGLTTFHTSFTGLFSSAEIQQAPWSLAKVWDLLKHAWVPMVVIGTGGTAGLIRIMRANLLDELHKPYVETARAKGLSEMRLLVKYPLRHAMNPFVSGFAYLLPYLVAGEAIVAIVMNLPTEGPTLLNSLLNLDVYLGGGILLLISFMTLISTLLSDILLAWLDPRIRYGN
ncbi:MAG: ABC transporter permease [Anaerolineae bacterium]|nr:ABC transporter permease [Anaerolineae bacterium]